MSSTELEIRVTAELREIKAALASLSTSLTQVGQKANAGAAGARGLTSELSKSAAQARAAAGATTGLQQGIARAAAQARLLLGSLGAVGLVTTLVRMADTATRLDGQLRLVTKTQGEFNRAQQETFAIAQRTRQGLEGTVNLYARIARAGKTNQETTLKLTESISQAVSLSFTTAEAAQAALFQLGQGLGSGTLRGEELNSVLEQTPRLAQAIAEGLVKLGKIKDPGDLRAFAQKNGIAAKLVVDAIATQQARLREEFAKLKPTVQDAFTALKNAGLAYVRDANSQTGATKGLADAILLLAQNFKILGDALVTFGQLWAGYFLAFRAAPAIIGGLAFAFGGVRTAIALATPAMTAAAGQALLISKNFGVAATRVGAFSLAMTGSQLAMTTLANGLKALAAVAFAAFAGWKIGKYLKEQFLEVELAGIALAEGLHRAAFIIGHSFETAGVVIKAAFSNAFAFVKRSAADLLDKVAATYRALPEAIGGKQAELAGKAAAALRASAKGTESVTAAYGRMAAEGAAGLAKIHEGYSALADAAIAARGKVEAVTAAPEGGGATGGGDAGKAVRGLVDQLTLAKDAAERALAALDRLYEDNGISVRAYFAEKVRLQQASIDADIAMAQRDAAAATTTKERSAALTQIIILERQRKDVALIAARDQLKVEDDLVDKLGEVKARIFELQGQSARARVIELEKQYQDLLQRLEVDADETGKALVRKLINLEAAKAGLNQFKDEFGKVTGALSQLEQTTAAQISAGLLSNATGEARLADARDKAREQLLAQRDAVAALYDQYKDPEALLQLQALDEQIARLSVSVDDWRGKVQDASTTALTTFFRELVDGSHTAGEAVRNLAVNFTQALAGMAAQALAKKAIGAIFDLFSGGGGEDEAGGGAAKIATAAAAGLAYSAPVTTAATALGLAGSTIISGSALLAVSAAQLQAAATTLLIANSASAASAAHSGGVVGALYQTRNLAPWVFAGAPRYHGGGIAGLAPDEVPTVLRRGEEVLTRDNPRHRFNGGGAAAETARPRVTSVVAIGDAAVADALAGAAGEDVVMTHVRRNWNSLTQGGGI